ncbi:unannotated protein [freshwater metagenome]|uniref:Unannotated protein n=1 Tax=freshwater metagenome TaxID=449393 RepID=A0A6J7DYT0_9ZZZZ
MTMRKGRPYDPAWDLWRPQRRWTGVVASAIVCSIFLGVVAFHYTSKPTPPVATIAPGAQSQLKGAYFPPVAPNSKDIQRVSGTKSTSAINFTTTGKLMIWYFQCACRANFGVLVHDSKGAVLDVPANQVGRTVISMPARYPQGKLSVNVIADGQWTISLIDPTNLPSLPLPYEYLSGGLSVLGPFSGPSAQLSTVFLGGVGKHFVMTISDGTLYKPMLLYYESQTFDRPMNLPKLPPRYWLIINGNGLWQVKVKK